MKNKKMTILLAALLFVGCGKIEETAATPTAVNDTDSELSATSPVSDSSRSSQENTEMSPDNGSNRSEETQSNLDGAAGYFGTYINDKNCIITIGTDEEFYKDFVADKQLLYYSAERVIDQYNCIADRDKQGFFDLIDYRGLYKSGNAPMFWAQGFLKEHNEPFLTEEEIYWAAAPYTEYLLGDELASALEKYPESGDIHETDYTRDEVLSEFRDLMDKAAEKAALENSETFIDENSCFNRLLRKPGSITNEEYFSSSERFRLDPSDDIVCIINMEYGCVRHDIGGIYVNLYVTVLDGDYAYDLDDCRLWLTESGDHVMPYPAAVYENPYKGQSREDIAASRNEDIRKNESGDDRPSPAEAANEGAWFNFNEGIYEGCLNDDDRTIWQRMLDYGSYALSVSDEGLPIRPDWSEDELGIGDYEIVWSMLDYGYDSGTVWIRPEPDGSGDFYTIYESPDGQREEYHTVEGAWF